MKKRMLIMALVCCLLLCGCGKVGKAEEAIAAMGTITPDSGDVIDGVQVLLNDMSERQLGRVENLQTFRDNEANYQRMWALIDEAKGAIKAIGNVTPDSGEKIEAARNAYEALKADNLTDYVKEEYPVLEEAEDTFKMLNELLDQARSSVDVLGEITLNSKAYLSRAREAIENAKAYNLGSYLKVESAKLEQCEKTYANLDAEDLYEKTIAYLNSGDYWNGNDCLTKLKTNYPSHAKAQVVDKDAEQVILELLLQAMKSKSYMEADNILKYCDLYFSHILKGSSDLESARSELYTTLEKQRPNNGKVFHNSVGGGWGQLKITANPNQDALVRVEGSEDRYILFYVRKGETAKVSVKDGSYRIYYCTGDYWYSVEDGFGVPRKDYKLLRDGLFDFIVFTTEYSGGYVNYSIISGKIPG